ncbi:MAG: hypothetical protein F6K09_12395, partial [Merismopedia sp. SIO2A8]|nr:hypothetical protein [Merismopedia sp. SIO2A8]
MAWAAAVLTLAGLWIAPPAASAQEGQIECTVTENGTPGRGTVSVEQNGKRVASGACGRPMTVPAGKHKVTVTLEGALDNPRRVVEASVEPGKTARVAVDFGTAV